MTGAHTGNWELLWWMMLLTLAAALAFIAL
jgi:hypothetical protein